MSASKFPLKYALLVAALAQVMPSATFAAESDKETESAKVCEDCPDPSGRSGWVEVGIGHQSDDAYHFGRYTGHEEEGAFVNINGSVSYRGGLDGAYLDGKVENLGLESRGLSLEGGRQGKYDIAVEYDQLPNFRKDLPRASLQTERDRMGVKFSLISGKAWQVSGHYRREEKEGVRDVGAGFGFDNPQILAVPVDYQTDDFGLALGYQGERLQANLAYSGSLFKNGQNSIAWNNPAPGPATGRIAESPDNEFHQLSAKLGYQLSEHTRIGASFAQGRMTQDQAFLPFSTTGGGVLPVPNLSGEVDTTLAKVDISTRPSSRLRLDGSYTYSDRDNSTPVNSYTYVLTDTLLSPARTNRPYSFEQNLLRLKAGYRLSGSADLSGGFDNDRMQRTYQHAEETEDQTLWAKLKIEPVEGLETTFKLSHSDRDASAYDPTAFQSSESPLMKAFELADRSREKIGIDLAYTARESLNLGFSLDYYKDEYKNMVLGLTEASGVTATPSLTYTHSDNLSASAYYTFERLKSEQSGQEWSPVPAPGLPANWFEADTNETGTFGMSVNWKAIPKKLDVGADLVYSEFTGKMYYNAGGNLPEITSSLAALALHGTYRMQDNMSFRVDYRYERYREHDWANVNLPTVTSLGISPETQETHLIFLSLRYAFK